MKIKEAKRYLNQRVHYSGKGATPIEADYILTACTIRKKENGGGEEDYFYQAELQDLNNHRSILIAKLEDIDPLQEQS